MLEALSRSEAGMRLALGVGRAIPTRLARRVVNSVADRMAGNPDAEVARAARANQYVVSGMTLSGEALEQAARENVRDIARSLYDLYHVLGNERAEWASFHRDETFERFLEEARSGPCVYVGAHLGNFDLVGRMLARAGWRVQVLSAPDPNGGYEWQNRMREQVGFEMTPVSLEALKLAARRLESGGSILTGADWPMPEPDKAQPRFFGHPAPLPLTHVRLAMRAGVPVRLIAGPRAEDGRYHLHVSEPVEMIGAHNKLEDVVANAERVLAPAERLIAELPRQWAMPHVVWPEIVVPS
jgi:KDO2-lipid IV(A) lauroyltransferase